MRRIQTDVLVIGGGATGTGVARDLAMRGFKVVLVERRDFNHGTTGRYHGLLHSGGRYVVKDPQAAKECIEENRILRKIMPQCLEDTGGFFVLTPWDDPNYIPRFLDGCRQAGIPVEDVPISQMLREEPSLNPKIIRCFRLPDASADSFLASELNAESAKSYGATIMNYCEVARLLREKDKIIGASCQDLTKDESVDIFADMVVNAAGAWVGKIAQTANIQINILPGKGTMVAINHRIANTVINRCQMPSDGDILVPIHTICVMGTTDIQVRDPDDFTIEPWEIRLMLDEGEKLIPGFKHFRVLRCWAGVRPLYQEKEAKTSRDISRAYALLDHEQLDGVSNLVTITSGKWTTYRLMAQETANLVCEKLQVNRPCRTHLEALPAAKKTHYHTLGKPLTHIEEKELYGELVCECELATRSDILNSLLFNEAKTIDDIRRDTRLGMGPCQGGFCTYRVAGIIHQIKHPPVEEINVAIRDFLQERWKGLIPILWGEQLRQERLNELIYINILNANRLPGPRYSKIFEKTFTKILTIPPQISEYSKADRKSEVTGPKNVYNQNFPFSPTSQHPYDVLIIGAGLAGLTAAWQLTKRGLSVQVVAKGLGATHWHTGCIDILGYHPVTSEKHVESPRDKLIRLIDENPKHPYAYVGLRVIENAIKEFQELASSEGYPFLGSIDSNFLLPTATGAIRPTSLVPTTMVHGDLRTKEPMLIVGFDRYMDFYPDFVADNLSSQGYLARGLTLDLKILHECRLINTIRMARFFEEEEFCEEVVKALKSKMGNVNRVGFPAILGIHNPVKVVQRLENGLGVNIFEIPTIPPSVPGIRLHNLLTRVIEKNHGRIYTGMDVFAFEKEDHCVTKVWSRAAARSKHHLAKSFVLATGGILGGGIVFDPEKQIKEVVFGLSIPAPQTYNHWLRSEFLDPQGHPLFRSGIQVNQDLQPITEDENLIFKNLYVVGTTLGHCDVVREFSLEGVALSTGYKVGKESSFS